MPGITRKMTPSQRDNDHDFDRPSGTESLYVDTRGTSCLATISLSLWDKAIQFLT